LPLDLNRNLNDILRQLISRTSRFHVVLYGAVLNNLQSLEIRPGYPFRMLRQTDEPTQRSGYAAIMQHIV